MAAASTRNKNSMAASSAYLRITLLLMLTISVIPVIILLVALTSLKVEVPCLTDLIILRTADLPWYKRERRPWRPARIAGGERCDEGILSFDERESESLTVGSKVSMRRNILAKDSLESAHTGRGLKSKHREQGTALVVRPHEESPTVEDQSTILGQKAAALMQQWSDAYGLSKLHPPNCVDIVSSPRAPHLEECAAATAHRAHEEFKTDSSGYPDWACGQKSLSRGKGPTAKSPLVFCDSPNPPWVSGSNDDNLPLTRSAQRDLWVHQFPSGNCSDSSKRFLLVDWWSMYNHGIGSQIHLMSAALSLAYATGRILVAVPRTFHRANHHGCERTWTKAAGAL